MCVCVYLCMCLLVTQLCLNLYDLMDSSLPRSSVHEILQAKILEWVAIPFSRGFSWPREGTVVSRIAGRFFIIWATREAPFFMFKNIEKGGICSAWENIIFKTIFH